MDKEEIKKENEELSEQISKILFEAPIETFEDVPEENLPKINDIVGTYDYNSKKETSLSKARRLLVSLLDFYLTEEFINKNQYIIHKSKIDEMGLSQIMTQISHNDRMIEILMKMVDSGELSPRIFDTFSTLQRTHIELLKMQAMYLVNMEETIKKIRGDYDFYKTYDAEEIQENSTKELPEKSTYKGTRDLMKELEDEDDFNFENKGDD